MASKPIGHSEGGVASFSVSHSEGGMTSVPVSHSKGGVATVPVSHSKVGVATVPVSHSEGCVASVPVSHSEGGVAFVHVSHIKGGMTSVTLNQFLLVVVKEVWPLHLLILVREAKAWSLYLWLLYLVVCKKASQSVNRRKVSVSFSVSGSELVVSVNIKRKSHPRPTSEAELCTPDTGILSHLEAFGITESAK